MKKYGFRQIKQKTKSHCEKRNEKMEVFFTWEDYGLKRPKHLKRTKIDYVMWGISILYSDYHTSIKTW